MKRTSPRMCSHWAQRSIAHWKAAHRLAPTTTPWRCCIGWPLDIPASAAQWSADARDHAHARHRYGRASIDGRGGGRLGAAGKGPFDEEAPLWQHRMKGLKIRDHSRGILWARPPAGCWSFASRGTVSSSVSSFQPSSAPDRTATQARSSGRRDRRCPYRYRNPAGCLARERSQSRQSEGRHRPIDLGCTCEHKTFHAVRDSKRTFADSQSVRTTAGSSTKADAKQTLRDPGLHRQRPRQPSAARPPRRS